jgi:hypothetical protein
MKSGNTGINTRCEVLLLLRMLRGGRPAVAAVTEGEKTCGRQLGARMSMGHRYGVAVA